MNVKKVIQLRHSSSQIHQDRLKAIKLTADSTSSYHHIKKDKSTCCDSDQGGDKEKILQKQMEGIVSKETMLVNWMSSDTGNLVIKQVDDIQINTLTR